MRKRNLFDDRPNNVPRVQENKKIVRHRFHNEYPITKLDESQTHIWIDSQWSDELIIAMATTVVEDEIKRIKQSNNGIFPTKVKVSKKTGRLFNDKVVNQYYTLCESKKYITSKFPLADLNADQQQLVLSVIDKLVDPLLANKKAKTEKLSKVVAKMKKENNDKLPQ